MTPSRPESQATPCAAPLTVSRAAGPNPMRWLHSLDRFIPRTLWQSISVFHDGGVQVVLSDKLHSVRAEKATKDTSGLPSRDASRLNNDDGRTAKKTSARKSRRRVSKAKKQQKNLRWRLRGFTRKLAASRIQRAFRFWKTSQVSRSTPSSSTMASTGISHADPTPSTSTTTTSTSRASRTSAATEVPRTSTATYAPPPNRPNRPRDKTKRGVS